MTWVQYLQLIGSAAFILTGVLGFGWHRILKETNALLREQNTELKSDNKIWQEKHEENVKAIAKLQGQVDSMKNIPLKEISLHMQRQSEINERLTTFLESKLIK